MRLPAELAEWVYCGCWHTSAPAIAALRAWRDSHPEAITARNNPALYAEYEALANQVTTPGDVLRAAALRALSPA
ncbi:hypothetical protein [Microbispora sp. NBRC 16548]|uniref:hypothetical protein n=1 Tax=Microbispora sp. NBRC 16548 TaxID=3030994 RepID=UPI002553C4CA|nr:hypothetical protein [Microbispora sp. NBRC 16548]